MALRLGVAGVLALLAAAALMVVRQPHAQQAAQASSATGALAVVPIREPMREPSTDARRARSRADSRERKTDCTCCIDGQRTAGARSRPRHPTQLLPLRPRQPAPAPNSAPTPPTVTIAAPSKRLDSDVVSGVLRAHDGELQRCYEDAVVAALMKQGSQPGADPAPIRLDAELEINPAGDVRDVTLRGAAPDAMLACARTAIRAWRFPAAGDPTSVRVPMVFQPSIVRQ